MGQAAAQQAAGRIDWRGVMAPGGRWSPLVHMGATPASVARSASGLAYLCAPYAGAAQVRGEWRPDRSASAGLWAALHQARLWASGVVALCPTVMRDSMCSATHALADPDLPLAPLDAEAWARWSYPQLVAARLIVVPDIPGWDRCPMIWAEVAWALGRQMPVHLYARGP